MLSAAFHIFLKLKNSNKITRLRVNPSARSASLKEINLFLQSLIEGHF
jgi:hypothetical protein